MATLIMGGKEITIPKMNLRRIKKAYPFMQRASQINEDDPFASYDDAVEAIRVGLEEDTGQKDENGNRIFECPISTEQFNDDLLGDEVIGLQRTMADMMRESGLVRQKSDGSIVGNEPGVESPENSTAISTTSLPNSSQQDAKEEVGAK